jgi:hypothetical protein
MSSFSNNVFEEKYSSFFGTYYISFQIAPHFYLFASTVAGKKS